jgi:hypothetical protein
MKTIKVEKLRCAFEFPLFYFLEIHDRSQLCEQLRDEVFDKLLFHALEGLRD